MSIVVLLAVTRKILSDTRFYDPWVSKKSCHAVVHLTVNLLGGAHVSITRYGIHDCLVSPKNSRNYDSKVNDSHGCHVLCQTD